MANIPPPPPENELFSQASNSSIPPPPPEEEVFKKPSKGDFAKLIGKIALEMHSDTRSKVLDVTALPKKAIQTVGTTLANIPEMGPSGALADAAMNVMKPDFKPTGVGERVAELGSDLADPRFLGLAGPAAKSVKPAIRAVGAKLEALGAKGQNFAAELRPQTIESMITKANPNPGKIGEEVGNLLSKEGIVGATPKNTMDNLIKAHTKAGDEVGQAIKNIHGSGRAAINAEKALQPLAETVKEYSSAMTGTKRNLAKHFEEVLNHFKKQSSQDGMLSFDDVTKALKEVGPLTSKGSDEAQQAMSLLYGKLANVRDEMVKEVATKAKNPSLREALLKANKKFSTYTRIMPDIERSAAKEAVGASSPFAGPVDALKQYAAKKASGLLNKAGTAMKGFGLDDKNRQVLDQTLQRMRNAK